LMDKVFALDTLTAAWTKVEANAGAAGVDGQSIERFAAKADVYLAELSTALREGSYRPQAANGSKSRRAMARRGRWAFQRSRTVSLLAMFEAATVTVFDGRSGECAA